MPAKMRSVATEKLTHCEVPKAMRMAAPKWANQSMKMKYKAAQ